MTFENHLDLATSKDTDARFIGERDRQIAFSQEKHPLNSM